MTADPVRPQETPRNRVASAIGRNIILRKSPAEIADAVLPIVEEETASQLAALRDKVKALVGELDAEADRHDPAKRPDGWRFSPEMAEAFRADATAKRYATRRLRALVEEPQGGKQ